MTGKEKCEFLKEIRRRMAAENGIPYKPRECHHEGDCLGTCPLCDKEAADLLEELKRKELSGGDIHVYNDAIEVLEQISGGKKGIEDDENEVQLLGDIPAGGFIRSDEELERIRREEEYRNFLMEKEKYVRSSNKSGIWDKIKMKLRNRFLQPMGIIDEEEFCDNTKEMEPLMGIIRCDSLPEYDTKPEREPDITWNLDEDDPIISNPERIISRDTITKVADPEEESE